MEHDSRKPLPEGSELTLHNEHNGNHYSCRIEKLLGRGGSCLVYQGIQTDAWVGEINTERAIIIKELYPQDLSSKIERSQDLTLVLDPDILHLFSLRKNLFCQGLAKHVYYIRGSWEKALPGVDFTGDALGTFYAVFALCEGRVLSDYPRAELSLNKILRLGESICEAIHAIHVGGKANDSLSTNNLYLDCKPDNIYVCKDQAYLFDFDTVQPRESIKYCFYSKGYSAPELEPGPGGTYRDKRKIGYHTDIFSIGVILFEMLTGRNPYQVGLENLESFDWSHLDIEDETGALQNKLFLEELSRILNKFLEPDPLLRKADFGDKDGALHAQKQIQHLQSIARHTTSQKSTQQLSTSLKTGLQSINKRLDGLQTSLENDKRDAPPPRPLSPAKITGLCLALISIPLLVVLTQRLSPSFQETAETFSDSQNPAIDANPSELVQEQDNSASEKSLSDNLQEDDFLDGHVIFKLKNANHQYEMGMENWRRMDYIRAERDILQARNSISEELSQAELDVARVNHSLGCLYLDMGRYADAYDYLNAAFVTFRDKTGEDSLETLAIRQSIALYFYNTGKPEDALREIRYILDASTADTSLVILTATSHLQSMIYDAQGKYDQALVTLTEALDRYKDIAENGEMRKELANYATDSSLSRTEKDYYTNAVKWVMLTYNNISAVSLHKKDIDGAINAASKGLNLCLNNEYLSKRTLIASRLFVSLGLAQAENKEMDIAIENIDLAKRIQINIFQFQESFPGLVEVYDAYGEILLSFGETKDAGQYFAKALEIGIDSYGENHPLTAKAYDHMGHFLCSQNLQKGVELLERALEIRKNILAENHPDTALIYKHLAEAYKKLGDEEKFAQNMQHADKIYQQWEMEDDLLESPKTTA